MPTPFRALQHLNEHVADMAKTVLAAGKPLTTATFFAEYFRREHVVTEIVSQYVDPTLLANDFESLATGYEGDQISEEIKQFFSRLGADGDVYADELTVAYIAIIEGGDSANIFLRTVSRYVSQHTFSKKIEARRQPAPVLEWEHRADSILSTFGVNLVKKAQAGEIDAALSRDEEIQRMEQILIRKTKNNPTLVGEPGTGKTAIVEGLALLLANNEVTPKLAGSGLYELNLSAVHAASGGNVGKLGEILGEIIAAAKKERAILFIDEIHAIMAENGKIANILKPAMARGEVKLIGATTSDEFKEHFDSDEAMKRRMQVIRVEEVDDTSVYRILQQKAKNMEEFHNVIVPNAALLKAITLSNRYMTERNQPDKAIDLIEEASSKLRMTLESRPTEIVILEREIGKAKIECEMMQEEGVTSDRAKKTLKKLEDTIAEKEEKLAEAQAAFAVQKGKIDELREARESIQDLKDQHKLHMHNGRFSEAQKLKLEEIPAAIATLERVEKELLEVNPDEQIIGNVVQPDMVARVIEGITGIPVRAQGEDDIEKYRNIEETLLKKVHGQDEVIHSISEAIQRSKAGLSDPNKPIMSCLSLGPTGVGKTFTAEQLAEFMFDTTKVMHRFDMSEFAEPHSISRLFGSPPGYVGYAEGGQLTEAVRRNPYSILLFDEIEKAHPKVFDSFLQILDAGRMTDGQGNTVDFKNTIIIMTSNIGSTVIQRGIEDGYPREVIEEALGKELLNNFRPEFLNRFDVKVMYNSLSIEDVLHVAQNELEKFQEKLSRDSEIELYWSKLVPAGIAVSSYDPMNGARPIKRFINNKIVNALTQLILKGEVQSGGSVWCEIFGEEFTMIPVTSEELKEAQAEDEAREIPSLTAEYEDEEVGHEGEIPLTQTLQTTETTETKEEDEATFPSTETGDR